MIVLLLVLAAGVVAGLLLLARRQAGRAQPLPGGWQTRLYARVPQAAYVPDDLRGLYQGKIEAFLRRKQFIGCNRLVVDDDMRLAVAGLACLLVLRDDRPPFAAMRSVLLYPDAFLVHHQEPDELGLVDDAPIEQIGESWQGDRILLSWADVDAALAGDSVNVVIHEFAHQLDDENPWSEGAPPMSDYAQWSQVMRREYERLRRHRRPPVLDPYGADSPGEFFGVVSEAFFQRPRQVQRHHADLYALLSTYYRLDPAAQPPCWPAPI